MRRINPLVQVDTHEMRLDAANVAGLVADYDIICDGTDNFATRFLVADACVAAQRTLVSAAVLRFEGQLSTFKPHADAGGPAIAACTRSRRRRGWCRAARRPGCWAR